MESVLVQHSYAAQFEKILEKLESKRKIFVRKKQNGLTSISDKKIEKKVDKTSCKRGLNGKK